MSGFAEVEEPRFPPPPAAPPAGRVRHNRLLPARTGEHVDWPAWVDVELTAAWGRCGVKQPWRHQIEAAAAARSGRHVVFTTGTASGKSLGYLLPILAATHSGETPAFVTDEGSWRQRPHTALYLAPTKALAHDQLRRCAELGLNGWRIAAVDGDAPLDERDWARDYATFVLTNPDLLHYSLLPQHGRWRSFLQALRYVVVDEAHGYRGVFGAHVAAVLRRLRRLAAHYGARPRFLLSSATLGDAPSVAAALTGLDPETFALVDHDLSRRGAVAVDLWQPDEAAEDLTAQLLAAEVAKGRQTIAFVASRRLSEIVAVRARDLLGARAERAVEAYRGGFLAADRRRIEADLQSGQLRGIAATNALELGVDISGVDTVIICGYPGTQAALWQQAGRAGRGGHDASVLIVGRRRPLDAYLLEHPDLLFDPSSAPTLLHPDNPHVLGPHLAAAAQELPLTGADVEFFGSGLDLAERLSSQGRLRKRPGGYFWTRPGRAVDAIDLRTLSGDALDIVDEDTGRVLGHVDAASADLTVHPGAVYLHLGETYLCEEWDTEDREILVRAARPGYLTQPQQDSDVRIVTEEEGRSVGRGRVHRGEVEVASRVTAYLRRDQLTGQVWDSTPLDLPERRISTTAVWWTLEESELPEELRTGSQARVDAGVHAAEHLCLGLLPAFALCDTWDVGAHSDARHRQTGAIAVFVHDRHAGGLGLADRAFAAAEGWLAAALERVRTCECELGCPACILLPCGSSRALDKSASARILGRLLDPSDRAG